MSLLPTALAIAATGIAMAKSYRTYRQPSPPAWTQRTMVTELICVGLVMLIATTACLVVVTAVDLYYGIATPRDLMAGSAVLVAYLIYFYFPRKPLHPAVPQA